MKIYTRIWAMLLCVQLCVSLLPAAAFAEADGDTEEIPADEAQEISAFEDEASFETFEEAEEPAVPVSNGAALTSTGTYGGNLSWVFSDGTLIISGSGAMADDPLEGENVWNNPTTVIIGDEVTGISSKVFAGCTSLKSVSIGKAVTGISSNTFSGCTNLNSVTIGAGVTSIGEAAFKGCSALTSVTIPSGVTSIGNSAFMDCVKLESVTIPASVSTIDKYAFCSCTALTTVTIPSGVTTVNSCAFALCTSLKSVTFEGNAPAAFASDAFTADTLTATYPANNTTWTDTVKQQYGGTVIWVASSSGITPTPSPEPSADPSPTPSPVPSATPSPTPSAPVTVDDIEIVTPDGDTEFIAGRKVQLSVNLAEEYVARSVSWSIVENVSSQKAAISSKGVLTIAKTCPEMTITVKAVVRTATELLSDTIELYIIPRVTKLQLTAPAVIYLYDVGETAQLGVTAVPAGASSDVVWSSVNSGIAAVDQDGLVTSTGGGTTIVRATATDGSNKTAKYVIKVVQPVTSLSLISPYDYCVAGSSVQLKATVEPSNATEKTVVWSLSADDDLLKYLSINSSGKLSVSKKMPSDMTGTLTVSATATGAAVPITEYVTLQIMPKASYVTLYQNGTALSKNAKQTVWKDQVSSFQLTAVATSSSACQEFKWKSSNTAVATVDETGFVTVTGKGSTTITATVKDGSNVSAKMTLTVNIPAESVEITNASAQCYLAPGTSFTPKATVYPSNVSSKNVVWSLDAGDAGGYVTFSSKTGKISVSKKWAGDMTCVTLTAYANGTPNVVTDSVTFILLNEKVSSIKLYSGETNVTGKTVTLSTDSNDCMSLDAFVNPAEAAQDVVWTTSNANVATVDEYGYVIAVGKGTATITATATDGSNVTGKVKIKVSGPVTPTPTPKKEKSEDVLLAEDCAAAVGDHAEKMVPGEWVNQGISGYTFKNNTGSFVVTLAHGYERVYVKCRLFLNCYAYYPVEVIWKTENGSKVTEHSDLILTKATSFSKDADNTNWSKFDAEILKITGEIS